MAINYTNLFDDIGEVISAIEEFETMMATVEARRTSMIAQLTTSTVTDLITNVNQVFDSAQASIESIVESLIGLSRLRLQDRTTVVEELPNLTSTSLDSVIFELIADMITNSETVKESTVGLGSVTKTTIFPNTPLLITTSVLPGNVAPGQGFKQNRNMAGETIQLPLPDDIRIICRTDSQQGTTVGRERFDITGNLPAQSSSRPFTYDQGGNRGQETITVAEGSSKLGFFSAFTTDVPSGWTVQSGTATTDFAEYVADSFNADDVSLEFLNTATGALRYNIYSLLTPGENLCLYFYIKKKGATSAGTATVNLLINGVSFIGNAVTVVGATEWTISSYTFTVPSNIGEDDGTTYLELVNGATTDSILIDGGVLTGVVHHAGIGLVIPRGRDKFLIDDQYSFAVTNDEAGKIQRFFVRAFGYQLPSATAASETISDPI